MLTVVARKWWMVLLSGACSVLFGLMALAWPGITLAALVILFGAYCLADGITAIGVALGRDDKGKGWRQMLVLGCISIVAGFGSMIWPGMTALLLLMIIAGWSIVRGIAEIFAAIELRKVIQNEWLLILSGVISIGFGIVLIVHPGAGALAVIWVIGCFAIVRGAFLMALALRLRGHHQRASHAPASATTG